MIPTTGNRTPLPEIQRGIRTTLQRGQAAEWNSAIQQSETLRYFLTLCLAAGLCVSLTGCFGFLKPATSTARHFVLTPLPVAEPAATPASVPAVGLGQVKLPTYLFNSSLAVRRGTNEIDYSQSTFWAERLDIGVQRVLGANLSTLLHTHQIRLSSWRSEDVSVEIYVAVEQFEVDAAGEGVLVARWRILAPGGEKLLRSGESRFKRQGPEPDKDPAGAIGTLSGLVGDLGKGLAEAVGEIPNLKGRA